MKREVDELVAAPAGKPPRKANEKEDRHFVTALARGLEVLSCFRSGEQLLGNQEVAAACKLPRSTAARLTHTLSKLGYLHYVPSLGKYRLGMATLAVGSAMLSRFDARQLARPLMQELADFSQTMVSLGVRDKLSMIYVENCRSRSALTLSLDVGSRIPVATTAMGRAYLAACSEGERRDVLENVRDLDALAWPRIRDGIAKALTEFKEIGCCTSFGDWQPDVNAIAVGFSPGEGMPPMSINCGGPSFKLTPEYLLNEVRPSLLEGVRLIEARLGR